MFRFCLSLCIFFVLIGCQPTVILPETSGNDNQAHEPPGSPEKIVYKSVNIKLSGEEAINWMEDNGYTVSGSGSYYISKKSSNINTNINISKGATFIGGSLYDKFSKDVGSLNISNGKISITIKYEPVLEE